MTKLNEELRQLEVQGINFAQRFISDFHVRSEYIKKIKNTSQMILKEVNSGRITPTEGARMAANVRNSILDSSRLKLSDFGQGFSQHLKKNGLKLSDLLNEKSQRMFGKSYSEISKYSQEKVNLEIIKSSGKGRGSMTNFSGRLARVGRGLFVLSAGVALYNIYEAESKGNAILKETTIIGGGAAGAYVGGKAGLLCGPYAVACVPVGVFLGGVMGACGVEELF